MRGEGVFSEVRSFEFRPGRLGIEGKKKGERPGRYPEICVTSARGGDVWRGGI